MIAKCIVTESYTTSDGGWDEKIFDEFFCFIDLVLYESFIKVYSLNRFWSSLTLCYCLWARSFMLRDCCKALLVVVHVDPTDPLDERDKVAKVRSVLDHLLVLGFGFVGRIFLLLFLRVCFLFLLI